MSDSSVTIHIHGMHCHGCERIVEHVVRKLPGVKESKADFVSETLNTLFDGSATIDQIRAAVEQAGYKVFAIDEPRPRRGLLARIVIAVLALLGVAAIVLLDASWISEHGQPDVTQHPSLGLIFVLGLLTGFHCVGMCGGFVLGYTAADAEADRRSYVSHVLYGAGKLLSYSVIGAGFGLVGQIVAFTPLLRGVVGLCAGAFLIIYGLNVLGYLKPLRRFRLALPAPLKHFVARHAGQGRPPFVIGLLNGLMIACGPLQALYVSAAGTGSAVEGAKMLFVFGLGTLPILMAFGMLTTILSGALTHRLLSLSGAIVILLGAVMMNRGMILTGWGYDLGYVAQRLQMVFAPHDEPTVELLAASADRSRAASDRLTRRPPPNDQTIEMSVTASGYAPSHFVLIQGVPVKWVIRGEKITMCNRRIVVPQLDLEFDIKPGLQTIEFTPKNAGLIPWSCWMGMLRGLFEVVDQTTAQARQLAAVAPSPGKASDDHCGDAMDKSATALAQRVYTVIPGDNFERIARKIYGDPSRARDIAATNQTLSPRRLRPGQKLLLPEIPPHETP